MQFSEEATPMNDKPKRSKDTKSASKMRKRDETAQEIPSSQSHNEEAEKYTIPANVALLFDEFPIDDPPPIFNSEDEDPRYRIYRDLRKIATVSSREIELQEFNLGIHAVIVYDSQLYLLNAFKDYMVAATKFQYLPKSSSQEQIGCILDEMDSACINMAAVLQAIPFRIAANINKGNTDAYSAAKHRSQLQKLDDGRRKKKGDPKAVVDYFNSLVESGLRKKAARFRTAREFEIDERTVDRYRRQQTAKS